jgi:hypothetical protein
MAAKRLPIPGQDNGTWGDILNGFLAVSHNPDGTLVPAAVIQAGAGTYSKSSTGIPMSDLDITTQTAINTSASKYTKPQNGIPTSDLDTATQTTISKANSAVQLGGDLNGTTIAPVVAKLQGTILNSSSPTDGQVLVYSSTASAWVPGVVSTTTVNDATSTSKGIVQLAGDLSGTGSNPTVPGLTAKLDASVANSTYAPKSSPTFTGVVTVPMPTNAYDAATKSYVDTQTTTAAVPDASSSQKGKIQLAGDLSGSAVSPAVVAINGVTITGSPTNGQTLIATSTSAAIWSTQSGNSGVIDGGTP